MCPRFLAVTAHIADVPVLLSFKVRPRFRLADSFGTVHVVGPTQCSSHRKDVVSEPPFPSVDVVSDFASLTASPSVCSPAEYETACSSDAQSGRTGLGCASHVLERVWDEATLCSQNHYS